MTFLFDKYANYTGDRLTFHDCGNVQLESINTVTMRTNKIDLLLQLTNFNNNPKRRVSVAYIDMT